jgi:hypothetical protein
MQKLAVIPIVLALPLVAGDFSRQTLSVTQTERFNVSAPGTIRLEKSFGELEIEGWDRPEAEVTVVRSSEHLYSENERAEAQRRLDQVQITSKQNGNDVVVSTVYPRRNRFAHPLSQRSDVEISYRIRAPRASKLAVEHNRGGVNVYDISGDIHATVGNGQITLMLAAGRQYAIDSRTGLGNVYSDLEGRGEGRHVLGGEFHSQGAAPATSIYVRVRVGDIVILQSHGAPLG